MNKLKHATTTFTTRENLTKHISSPFYKHFEELNEDMFEVDKQQRKVLIDLPVQIGLGVYSYAKLVILMFAIFLKEYLMPTHYQFMEMDTDSLYIAFADENIDNCVKPNLREKWAQVKWDWFSSEDQETMVEFDGELISKAQYDRRTPGKFKAEFIGLGMACLNSKVYHIWSEDKSKTSCKGVQQKRNELLKEHFLSVLRSEESQYFENAGFIKTVDGIKTYQQTKCGMSYFYGKRKVLEDGVSTTHLDI